jgi:hypothetical protein
LGDEHVSNEGQPQLDHFDFFLAVFFFADFFVAFLLAFFLRVAAAFLAEADFAFLERAAEAAPPIFPPFFAAELSTFLPRPEPLFLPPPVMSLTVAQARRLASFFLTPRSS